ncbi:MAG TPA: flocculation-associated PEP-CTERM protein PepA [Methylococcaceae bacterium]|nr:flocculation-associated PEP-CTERM protein PepA [Methylococcaceae bacterium]
MKLTSKTLAFAGLTAAMAITSTSAMAELFPDFQVNPSAYSPQSTFTADKIVGGYVEVAQFSTTAFTDALNFSGTFTTDIRWQASAFFKDEGTTQLFGGGTSGSGLNSSYGMYALFSGLTGTFNTVAGITTFTFAPSGTLALYIDPNLDTVFGNTTANIGVTANGGDDILIATGVGVAGTGTLNPFLPTCGTGSGTTINCGSFGATTSISLNAAGEAYFVDPVPFYPLAFEAGQFNNFNPASLAPQLINGSMDVKFGGSVPEPTTVALMGLGLLGLGLRRRKNVA